MTHSTQQQQIDALLKPMLKMRLYASINKAIKTYEEALPLMTEHLAYMIKLEQQGVLFASGPFIAPGMQVGLTILRASNIEQAKQYLNEEPLIKNGVRSYDIFEWELREGRFNVQLDFATGEYRVA